MPIPNRTRNKNGTFRKKRADTGKSRFTRVELSADTDEQIKDVLKEWKKEGIRYKEVTTPALKSGA